MKTKHTPGPWWVDGQKIMQGGDVPNVARDCVGQVFPVVRGNSEANARLIAAAPELLKALKVSLSEWAQYDVANVPGGTMELARKRVIRLAKQAIAKAEGGGE